MRSYKLSELLGLSGAYARRFEFGVSKIESKKPELKSVSAQIMAELYQKSHKIERELGFSGDNILMIEAFLALKNQLKNEGLWQKFGNAAFFCEDGVISVNKKDVEILFDFKKKNTFFLYLFPDSRIGFIFTGEAKKNKV